MINLKSIIALAFCLSIPISVMAKEADEAYKALRKFESKVETGVTYRKYLEDLSDVAFAVKEFLATAKGKKATTAKIYSKALDEYKNAGSVWAKFIELDLNNWYAVDMFQEEITPYCEEGAKYVAKAKFDYAVKSGFHLCLSEIWQKAKLITDAGHISPNGEGESKRKSR